PPLPSIPQLPPEIGDVVEPLIIPELPEPPEAPLPVISALTPEAELAPLPGGVIEGVPSVLIATPTPPAEINVLAQEPRATTITPVPTAPIARRAIVLEQDDKNRQPAIPEADLLNLLVDIVKRDADPNVRNEALQGIYRLRSDAAINALIQLYDSVTEVKVKSE